MNQYRMFIAIVCICLLSITSVSAQTVTYAPETLANLSDRWQWAMDQKPDKALMNGYWVGYSIKRMMEANSYIGSFHMSDLRSLPSIWEVITGTEILPNDEVSLKDAARLALDRLQGREKTAIIEKDIAILFRFDPLIEQDLMVKQIHSNTMSNSFRFKGLPVLWLGEAEKEESLQVLINLFKKEETSRYQEDLISAIGLHDGSPTALNFLQSVVEGNYAGDVREKAVFWIGQQNSPAALALLKPMINDHDEDIAEEVIFAISLMELPEAEKLLIDYAKNLQNRDLRKKAIFWLGQSVSKKVMSTLEEIAEEDDDIKIQESAIFAISQQESEESLQKLMKIATSHDSPRIRKKAIFWLGQSEDPRAVDFLISLLQQ